LIDLKALVRTPKRAIALATSWRSDQITPRLSPFPKSRPGPPGGVWRSVVTVAPDGQRFMIFAQVQEGRENFKAVLAVDNNGSWQVMTRLEYHGSHPGLHIHDWCGETGVPFGGRSFDAPHRRPSAGAHHRRNPILNRATFWKLALDKFWVIPFGTEQEDLL